MRNKLLMMLLLAANTFAQTNMPGVDSLPAANNAFTNPAALRSFYQKLSKLQQFRNTTVNIVHIGDSHIQADLMTGHLRKGLQQIFGNAGRGFVFPHSLAKTNGASDIRFSSTAHWHSHRNIHQPNGSRVGLSGISLETTNTDFAIELSVKDTANSFRRIKIITPDNTNSFAIATEKRTIAVETTVPKKVTHKIRRGETLSAIAARYDIGIAELKRANNLKSSVIRAGHVLRIPAAGTQTRTVERAEYVPLDLAIDSRYHYYDFDEPQRKIYIIPKPDSEYALSGIVLENSTPGVYYHNIGVNGAKFSDYNKYPLFFDQLRALRPDLIVLSLGTNESFDKMPAADYIFQMRLFIASVRAQNPDAAILISTPPPSLFSRRYPNTFVSEYADAINQSAFADRFAAWDLFHSLGGNEAIQTAAKAGLIGSDRVHYSKAGYHMQADLLLHAILAGLKDFNKQQ